MRFLILIFLLPITSASTDHLNYGISFKELGPVKFSVDVWKHSYLIGLPSQLDISLLQYCSSPSRTCMERNGISNNINAVRQELINNFNNTLTLVKELLPNTIFPRNTTRHKKALFGFLGSLAHDLFGVSTDDQLKQITNQMNILKKAMSGINNVMEQNNKEFASFVKTVDNRIGNLMQGMKENALANELLTEEIQSSSKSLSDFITATSAALAREIASSNYVSQSLDTLRQAITDLAEGQLSPSLIKPQMLSNTIAEIQDMLVKQYPNYCLAMTNVLYYYKQASFSVIRQDNNILITIDFPIASADTFNLFRVYSFPIPINQSSSHATQLMQVPDYIAITQDKQFYTTLSENSISYCKTTKQEKYCRFRPPLSAVSKKNCIANLFLNNRKEIKQYCNFRFLTDELHPHILHISDNKVVIYQMTKLILECPNNKRSILPGCESFCLMTVPCSCVLLTNDLVFQSPLTQCNNQTGTVDKVYPVNLALLQHFFNDTQLERVLANSTYEQHMAVIIPKLNIYRHKMSNILAKDQKFDFNLKKIADRVRNSSKIYSSLSEAYLDGQFSFNDDDFFDYKLLLTIIGLSLAIINSITMIYVFRKIQLLSTVLVMAHGVRTADTKFHFQPSQNIQENTEVETNSNILSALKWEHAIFVICLTTLIVITLTLIYRATTRKGTFTMITLEITNGSECVDIKVLKLPACPDFYTIQAPTLISQLSVTGAIKPHLTLLWPDFVVTDKASNKSIQASQNLPISWFSAYKLRQILQTPFLAYIAVKHHNCVYILDKHLDAQVLPTAPPTYIETARQITHM